MEKLTTREFLDAVITANITAEITEFAVAEKAKLDARNAKRRTTPTKTQTENESIKDEIVTALADREKVLASELAVELGKTTQKISALCAILVKENKVKVEDVKIKGKGTVKGYTLA